MPASEAPSPAPSNNCLRAGRIELDLNGSAALINGIAIRLTSKEFELLRVLMESKGGVVSREFLLDRIWGCWKEAEIDARTVDVHIHRLRQKLGPEGARILTVKNVGYRFGISSLDWIKFGALAFSLHCISFL